MNELNHIVEDLQSVFSDDRYPPGFLEAWDQMECLASHSGRETFLVRRKGSGEMAVAKCYDRTVFPLQFHPELLRDISYPGLPRFFEQYRSDSMLCVVREYIEGDPLSELAGEKQLPTEQILSVCDQLCGILSVLHSHTPPIIHRDIKPENIIIQPDGTAALIDFDISRSFKENAGNDTVHFGTRGYAPPEQYGFGQTDPRTDIYAFGTLLRFLLTGSTRHNPNITIDRQLQTVIDRCTAFSPEQRYADIGQVRQALKKTGSPRRRPGKGLLLAVILLCALLSGFAVGRFTDWFRAVPAVPTASFTEPLIEKAVLLQLGLDKGPVPEADLVQVRRICIYGNDAYADMDEFYRQVVDDHEKGPIRTLDDLSLLPGLEEVYIVRQGYVDISGIASLGKLLHVELKHMRISGVQPLADVPRLQSACLFDSGITDATMLEANPWLKTLDIGLNRFTSLSQIGFHPGVTSLGLMWAELDSLDGIAERFPALKTISLQHGVFGDLSGLKELKHLETVYVLPDQVGPVEAALAGTKAAVVVDEK